MAKKIQDWLMSVATIVNMSRTPERHKMKIFWSDDNTSGVVYEGCYIASDGKLGDRYSKNINISLKMFGPKGGAHELLQPSQKIQVNGGQFNVKLRFVPGADRTAAIAAVNALQINEDAKKLAVSALYSGATDFEIVASEDGWSQYDNIAGGAQAPTGGANQIIPPTPAVGGNAIPPAPQAAPAAPAPGAPPNPFQRP